MTPRCQTAAAARQAARQVAEQTAQGVRKYARQTARERQRLTRDRKRLMPSQLLAKRPWRGSRVEILENGDTLLTHPSGATMMLYTSRWL